LSSDLGDRDFMSRAAFLAAVNSAAEETLVAASWDILNSEATDLDVLRPAQCDLSCARCMRRISRKIYDEFRPSG
jgi:hypothetical protein